MLHRYFPDQHISSIFFSKISSAARFSEKAVQFFFVVVRLHSSACQILIYRNLLYFGNFPKAWSTKIMQFCTNNENASNEKKKKKNDTKA